jgi:hypothetical protein
MVIQETEWSAEVRWLPPGMVSVGLNIYSAGPLAFRCGGGESEWRVRRWGGVPRNEAMNAQRLGGKNATAVNLSNFSCISLVKASELRHRAVFR